MERGYANVRALVKTNPSLLPLVKDRTLLTRVVNDFLPYKVGIEVEVLTKVKHQSRNEELLLDVESNKLAEKGLIETFSHDDDEKRWLFPAGVNGIIGVKEVCNQLREHCYFNDKSGIHCNVSLESIPRKRWEDEGFKKALFDAHYSIINMIDVYDYSKTGKYNNAHAFCWGSKTGLRHSELKDAFDTGFANPNFYNTLFGWYAYRGGNADLDVYGGAKYTKVFRGYPKRLEIRVPPCIFDYKEMLAMLKRCSNVVTFIKKL